jgi:2'-5' RNA ligase
MKTIRSFLAFNIELEVIKAVAEIQIKLKDGLKETDSVIKWVPPSNMHLTIKFLGRITEPMIMVIKDHIEPLTRRTSPFSINLTGVDAFYQNGEPSVIFVKVEDTDGVLLPFYKEISQIMENTGFKQEEKPFNAHVTIGRVKKSSQGIIKNTLKEYEQVEFGNSTIKDFICYRSDITQKGADYQMVWRLPLPGRKRQPVPIDVPGSTDNEINPG